MAARACRSSDEAPGRRDGAAVATYAAVLDGVHLWLDVDGPVSVRDADSNAVTALGDAPLRPVRRSPGRRTTCWPARPPSRLAVARGRRSPGPRWRPDGATQWEVVRRDDGRLRLDPPHRRRDRRAGRRRRPRRPGAPADPASRRRRAGLPPAAARHRRPGPAPRCPRPPTTVCSRRSIGGRRPAGRLLRRAPARGRHRGGVGADPAPRPTTSPTPTTPCCSPSCASLAPSDQRPRARLRWNPDGLLALRSIDPDEAG